MFLTELFGHFSLSAFIMWAFLMALFFNIFVYSLDIKRNTTLLLSSFVMFLSCALFDYFLDWFSIYDLTYFDFVVNNFMIILKLRFKNEIPTIQCKLQITREQLGIVTQVDG